MTVLSIDPGIDCGVCVMQGGKGKYVVLHHSTKKLEVPGDLLMFTTPWDYDADYVTCEGSWAPTPEQIRTRGGMGPKAKEAHDRRRGWIEHRMWDPFGYEVQWVPCWGPDRWMLAFGMKEKKGKREMIQYVRKLTGTTVCTEHEACAALMAIWKINRGGK